MKRVIVLIDTKIAIFQTQLDEMSSNCPDYHTLKLRIADMEEVKAAMPKENAKPVKSNSIKK